MGDPFSKIKWRRPWLPKTCFESLAAPANSTDLPHSRRNRIFSSIPGSNPPGKRIFPGNAIFRTTTCMVVRSVLPTWRSKTVSEFRIITPFSGVGIVGWFKCRVFVEFWWHERPSWYSFFQLCHDKLWSVPYTDSGLFQRKVRTTQPPFLVELKTIFWRLVNPRFLYIKPHT